MSRMIPNLRHNTLLGSVCALASALAIGGCVSGDVRSKLAINLPPPPKFMGACKPSATKAGDQPNIAFDTEHAAFKQCSRQGAASLSWYVGLRKRYGASKLK